MTETIYAPFSGKLLDITSSSDPVFSEKMMGDGVVVEPNADTVIVQAPCDGKIVSIYQTLHAVTIQTTDQHEVLLHLGVDTVELEGKGFRQLIEAEATVTAGTPIIEMDVKSVREAGYDPNLVMVFLDKEASIQKEALDQEYEQGAVIAAVR